MHTLTHTLSHKSTKPISSLTKQTGSIKTDNPTNSKRLGFGDRGPIYKLKIVAHTEPVLNLNPSIPAQVGVFPPGLNQEFLLSARVTSYP